MIIPPAAGPKPKMKRRAHGSEYEEKAAIYFTRRGDRVIARNVNYKCGEIDLVVEEGAANRGGREGILSEELTLVFVEVRKRDPRAWISPQETVTYPKQRRLENAIQQYLCRYQGSAKNVRIDLLAFIGDDLRHFKDFMRL